MANQGLILGSVLSALVVAGCTQVEDSDDLGFRSAEAAGDFQYPGDGDIEVYPAGPVNEPDAIIWDLDDGGVARQVQPGLFVSRLFVVDNEFRSGSGPSDEAGAVPVCSVVPADHPSDRAFQLVDAEGEVIFTLWKRFVFAGDVELPTKPKVKKNYALQQQLAFSFNKDDIYAGSWWCGEHIATASERIARANPVRRLLLAALVAGECGSEGI